MPQILISYRRNDTDAIAGRIRDRVAAYFGEDSVFMDIDSIPFGLDFRHQVQKALAQNDVVLAIIGPRWTGGARAGSARIKDESDPVRIEVETALKRGIPVIPVLVGHATMPKVSELPDSLKDLPFLNAAEVSAGRDFNQHIDRLLRSIDRFNKHSSAPQQGISVEPAGNVSGSPDHDQQQPIEGTHSIFKRLMIKLGLQFEHDPTEREFVETFRDRFYVIGQTSMAFGVAGWIVFGMTDLLSGTEGLGSTRFRFMVALPIMFLFFALSFTQRARRAWQKFFAAFAVIGVTCMYISLLLVRGEAWFRYEQEVMSFMFFLAAVTLAPFTTVYTVVVGLMILIVHIYYVISQTELSTIHALFYTLFVGSLYAIAIVNAWAREHWLRMAFRDKVQASPGAMTKSSKT